MKGDNKHISTPDWDILGHDRIRRWPSKDESRDINIKINSWAGWNMSEYLRMT